MLWSDDWAGGLPVTDASIEAGTQDSLKLIRESTVRYVLADRRGASERFPEQVQHGSWQTRRADPDTGEAVVAVQEVGEEEGGRLILVRSRGCAQKEKGIHGW